jgi:hypothetical protein
LLACASTIAKLLPLKDPRVSIEEQGSYVHKNRTVLATALLALSGVARERAPSGLVADLSLMDVRFQLWMVLSG